MDFDKTKDSDFPSQKFQVIVFSPDDEYKRIGITHGMISHAIKHYRKFDKNTYAKFIDKAQNIIENNAPDFWVKDQRGKILFTKKSYKKFSHHVILNTLDMVNDKIELNKKLTPVESRLGQVLNDFRNAYQLEVEKLVRDATDLDAAKEEHVAIALRRGTPVSFMGERPGSIRKFFFDPKSGAFMVSDKSVKKIYTLYKTALSLDTIMKKQQIKPFNSDILKFLNEIFIKSMVREILYEYKKKKVIRKGKVVKKLDCPDGKKAVGGKCVQMKSKEKMARKRAARKAARKRKSKKSQIARQMKKSLKRRKARGLK